MVPSGNTNFCCHATTSNVREMQKQLASAWNQIPKTTFKNFLELISGLGLGALKTKGGNGSSVYARNMIVIGISLHDQFFIII